MLEHGTQRRGNASFIWRWGAAYGLVLGLIQGILSLLSLGSITTIIDLFLWLVGFFLVGIFAARETGKVGTGALMGLVTGLVGGLIALSVGIILLTTDGSQITSAVNQAVQTAQSQGRTISTSEIQTIATIGIVVGLTFTVIIELGLGVGIGALGGLVGRLRARPVD